MSTEFEQKVCEDLGAIKASLESMNQYVGAVAGNTKQNARDLVEHKEDDGAHGIKTMRWIIGSLVALILGLIPIWEAFKPHVQAQPLQQNFFEDFNSNTHTFTGRRR